MSVLRPLLSRRGRLVFVAVALLLVGALVAAPGISGAKPPGPASIKLFTAAISPDTAMGNVTNTWTETVHNCGPNETATPCNLSSTIGLAVVRVSIPSGFQTNDFSASIGSASGHSWTATYNSTTHVVTAQASTGSDKLQAGQSVQIAFHATPSTCATGAQTFSTQAWGDFNFSDQFTVAGSNGSTTAIPTVTITPNGACVTSGGEVTQGDQSETISGFGGHVIITFGGDLDCSSDPFGPQWMLYRLPTQVNITPGDDFVAGTPKISTSRFPAEEADSSLYLICYGVPKAGSPNPEANRFTTRGGDPAAPGTVNGVESWVGILPNCYNPTTEPPSINPPPCVSEQFLDITTDPDQIVISVRIPPGDPYKR
jgi:hypothetical protein